MKSQMVPIRHLRIAVPPCRHELLLCYLESWHHRIGRNGWPEEMNQRRPHSQASTHHIGGTTPTTTVAVFWHSRPGVAHGAVRLPHSHSEAPPPLDSTPARGITVWGRI